MLNVMVCVLVCCVALLRFIGNRLLDLSSLLDGPVVIINTSMIVILFDLIAVI